MSASAGKVALLDNTGTLQRRLPDRQCRLRRLRRGQLRGGVGTDRHDSTPPPPRCATTMAAATATTTPPTSPSQRRRRATAPVRWPVAAVAGRRCSASTTSSSTNASTRCSLQLTLSQPAGPGGVSVDYATADGTATAGADYSASSGTITLPEGIVSLMLQVPVHNDAIGEDDEAFFVDFSNIRGAVLGNGRATVTLDRRRLRDDADPHHPGQRRDLAADGPDRVTRAASSPAARTTASSCRRPTARPMPIRRPRRASSSSPAPRRRSTQPSATPWWFAARSRNSSRPAPIRGRRR